MPDISLDDVARQSLQNPELVDSQSRTRCLDSQPQLRPGWGRRRNTVDVGAMGREAAPAAQPKRPSQHDSEAMPASWAAEKLTVWNTSTKWFEVARLVRKLSGRAFRMSGSKPDLAGCPASLPGNPDLPQLGVQDCYPKRGEADARHACRALHQHCGWCDLRRDRWDHSSPPAEVALRPRALPSHPGFRKSLFEGQDRCAYR